MRDGLLLIAVVTGCGTEYYLDLSPRFDRAIGTGLTVDVYVDVEACSVDGFDEETCSLDQTDGFDLEIVDGDAVRIGPAATTYSDFTLTGAAAGAATLVVDGDHAGVEVPLTVRPVATTETFVDRWGGLHELPVEHGPVAAFTDSAELLIEQVHRDASGSTLLGDAAWRLDPGPTGSALAPSSTLAVGPTPGRATLTTPVGGELVIDVVDAEAMDTMEVLDAWSLEPVEEVERPIGTTFSIYLRAFDATRRTIVGWGPRPAWTVTPQTVVELENVEIYGDTREIEIRALAAGTATMQITWGPRTAALTIVIR